MMVAGQPGHHPGHHGQAVHSMVHAAPHPGPQQSYSLPAQQSYVGSQPQYTTVQAQYSNSYSSPPSHPYLAALPQQPQYGETGGVGGPGPGPTGYHLASQQPVQPGLAPPQPAQLQQTGLPPQPSYEQHQPASQLVQFLPRRLGRGRGRRNNGRGLFDCIDCGEKFEFQHDLLHKHTHKVWN